MHKDRMAFPLDIVKRQLNQMTHRIYSLPILVLMPHSRCNCRCLMCDIWKANANKQEISKEDLGPHLGVFRKFRVRQVLLSGGEALMHSNLWRLCELLREMSIKISLLSTGLLLKRHSMEIIRWCDEVIVSLDGSRQIHDKIRNVPQAFDRLAEGVGVLKASKSDYRITGRCVLHRENYFDLPNIIDAAHEIGLDQISFLAADVSTTAFNRSNKWDDKRVAEVALKPTEVMQFRQIIERVISDYALDFESGFVAESPRKIRRLPRYFAALNQDDNFPEPICNAPWVSTVIEADGTVRPCFFHQPFGNIHDRSLDQVLNSENAIAFRRKLDVKSNPICQKCTCSLFLRPGSFLKPVNRTVDTGKSPAYA